MATIPQDPAPDRQPQDPAPQDPAPQDPAPQDQTRAIPPDPAAMADGGDREADAPRDEGATPDPSAASDGAPPRSPITRVLQAYGTQAPPPDRPDGSAAEEDAPDPLGPRHPDGGYVAMRLAARMLRDLGDLTGGKRAATYAEVDEYLGHALLAEHVAPPGYTAGEATRWWRAGGPAVPGGPAVEGAGVVDDQGASLSPLDDRGVPTPDGTARIIPAVYFGPGDGFAVTSDGERLADEVRSDAISRNAKAASTPITQGDPANPKAKTLTPQEKVRQAARTTKSADLGTDLSTYDTGFVDRAHSYHGDYRTTPAERGWLLDILSRRGPPTPYPDALRTNKEKLSAEGWRKISAEVGYLYTLPEVKAFLDLLSFTEGTAKYGYYHGRSNSKLPDLLTFHGGIYASGRYQILPENWQNYGKKGWNRNDFSPITQDIIAITILRQAGVIEQLLRGNLSGALTLASTQFASIPQAKDMDYAGLNYEGVKGKEGQPQPTPHSFNDLPAKYAEYVESRRAEFRRAEQGWKTSKILPKAFISPLQWRSYGLDGFDPPTPTPSASPSPKRSKPVDSPRTKGDH